MGRGVVVKAVNSLVSRALFGLGAVLSFLSPLALGAQSATATTAARVSEITSWLALVLTPASFLMLWMVRKHAVVIRGMVALLLLATVTVGGVVGCGGSSSPKSTSPTGPQTILVNATTGTVTKTVPLTLNLQ
jgi:hypothetical protein